MQPAAIESCETFPAFFKLAGIEYVPAVRVVFAAPKVVSFVVSSDLLLSDDVFVKLSQ